MAYDNDNLLVCSVTVVLLVCLYVRSLWSYWQRRGVEVPQSSFFKLGGFGKLFLQKCTVGEAIAEIYNSSTQPLVGIYACFRPMVVPRDVKLINKVLVQDYQHFSIRGWYSNRDIDPLSHNLMHIGGEEYQRMRSAFSPALTLAKQKTALPTILSKLELFADFVGDYADSGDSLDMYVTATKHMVNVIAATAFGVEVDCFANPDEEFLKYVKEAFEPSTHNGIRHFLNFVAPKVLKTLKMRFYRKSITDFMTAMVTANLKLREVDKIVRKDFFQCMVQLRNEGHVKPTDDWSVNVQNDEKSKFLSPQEVAVQSYSFVIGGIETSSVAISYCLYELARNPDIQTSLHAEIDGVLAKYDGEITMDSLAEMKYLDCCIDEMLRMYPPLPVLTRECTKDYQVPGTDVVIEKGTFVLIPVWALHYDPNIYPEPHKFNPERFRPENRKGFYEQPWLPFGAGLRGCFGVQQGRVQTKTGLVTMLKNFSFELGAQMSESGITFSKKHLVPVPKNGIYLLPKRRA